MQGKSLSQHVSNIYTNHEQEVHSNGKINGLMWQKQPNLCDWNFGSYGKVGEYVNTLQKQPTSIQYLPAGTCTNIKCAIFRR